MIPDTGGTPVVRGAPTYHGRLARDRDHQIFNDHFLIVTAICMLTVLNILGYLCIAAAFAVHYLFGAQTWEPMTTFALAGLGIIPLAHLMGESTEHLARRVGATWGGLLNATFGNAAEIIIGIIGLSKGLNEVVKASLTGSIIGNLLLVGGASMLVGGWKREKQSFNIAAAETAGGMLFLAVAAMLVPAIFDFSAHRLHDVDIAAHEQALSIGTSVILVLVYVLGLFFTLRTHAHIFSPDQSESPDTGGWTTRKAAIILLAASVAVAIIAELLVGSAEKMADQLGWSPVFIGVILLAIIGNAAEHSTTILLARRNDMDTVMNIVYQSSLQIALFATPLLVFLSLALHGAGFPQAHAMDLLFTPLEVVSILLAVLIVIILNLNGETNWFEGVMLLALYALLALAFFYLPAATAHG